MQTGAAVLARRFGLTDDELLAVLDVTALELVGGELDHKPELALLLALSEDQAAVMTPGMLQRWVRTSGAQGRPIDLLLAHDFAGFERALDDLAQRGFVVRRS